MINDDAIRPELVFHAEPDNSDVRAAFEAKARKVAAMNRWPVFTTEKILLAHLRDTNPAEAATVAESLMDRPDEGDWSLSRVDEMRLRDLPYTWGARLLDEPDGR